ncbi:hypothetical protein WJU21_15615 [Emcibacter sp. SYSU 3D8]
MRMDQLHDAMVLALEKAGGKTPYAITGNKPTGKQADVNFRPEGIIAEVRMLYDDQLGAEQFVSSLYDMYNRWLFTYETPLVTGRGQINTADLPADGIEQLRRVVTLNLPAGLIAANKQIKQSRIDFGMRTAGGLLAYVLPLGVPIDPAIVLYFISRAFHASDEWPAIDHILLATCRVDEIDPDQRPPYWRMITRDGVEPLPAGFEDRLKTAWFGVLSQHFGKEIGYAQVEPFAGFGAP